MLVRADITVKAALATQALFKDCEPLTKYITKVDGTTKYDTKDLDLVMSM